MTEDWEPGLAATKVRPPVPPRQLVRRNRLDDILDAGVADHVPVLLVSAPAGSGKSTLLASWLAGRPETTAWLQAERTDSDPARFWSYLVEAIGRALPAVAADMTPAVVGSNGDDAVVVPLLVNRLSDLSDPLIVVIDDYHLVDDGRVHAGVERLIELCPPQVTVVLATRIDPPFRIARLRVRGHVREIRAAELRFEAGEALGLLGSRGRELDPELLAQLCDRTEGWAAALVLAGLSLERSPDAGEFVAAFRGDDQLVVEYLRDELLTGLDPDDRRILVETSILEQLCGDLVDAVAGTSGGAAWLRDTAQRNGLLLSLDRTGTWFRYHHLLRDLLRLEADEVYPDRLSELHARAAGWFESEEDHGRAIDHRLAGGDVVAAAALLRVHGPSLLRRGQVETLRGLLDRLGAVVATDAACALLAGWCAFIGGRYGQAEEWLDTTLAVAPVGFDELLTTPVRINVALARGDVTAALAVAAGVSADELRTRPADLGTAVGAAHTWAGRADEAVTALAVAVERAVQQGASTVQVLALVYRAVIELERGTPTSAGVAASAAVEVAESFGLASYPGVAPAYAIRARTGDDPDQVRADVAHALGTARRASTPLALGYVLAVCGDTLLDLGDDRDGDEGASLLAEARTVIDRCPDPGCVGACLARVESRHGVGGVAGGGAGPTRAPALVEQLTDREMAVLRYLPTSMSQRDIAAELYVSLNTVKTHCRAVYRKLGVGGRHAAVQAARELELL